MPKDDGYVNLLVGLQVTDEESYGRYREGLRPILEAHGGSFRHDWRIAEVLKTEADHPINRLFVISFPSSQARERFFGNDAYLKVKQRFFEGAVGGVTVLAEYTTGG